MPRASDLAGGIREAVYDEARFRRQGLSLGCERHGDRRAAARSRSSRRRLIRFGVLPDASRRKSETWHKMFHYYNYRRDEFLRHYHQRSNVETAVPHDQVEVRQPDTLQDRSRAAKRSPMQGLLPQSLLLGAVGLPARNRSDVLESERVGSRVCRGAPGRIG